MWRRFWQVCFACQRSQKAAVKFTLESFLEPIACQDQYNPSRVISMLKSTLFLWDEKIDLSHRFELGWRFFWFFCMYIDFIPFPKSFFVLSIHQSSENFLSCGCEGCTSTYSIKAFIIIHTCSTWIKNFSLKIVILWNRLHF